MVTTKQRRIKRERILESTCWKCCDVPVGSVCAQEVYILDNENFPRFGTLNYTIDSVKVSLENWVHIIQNMVGK
jgi:hypothetical protein